VSIEPSSLFARIRRRLVGPPAIAFGSFGTTAPISRDFGFDRGQPIDRYYIETFIARHAGDIRGHVLEVEEATYCSKYGGKQLTRQEVLHLYPDAPGATLSGDLAAGDVLPARSLDCVVLTQTLHLIYDMPAAVAEIRRGLAPGGVALVTVPGISQIDANEWASAWCWSLTAHSARRLFEDVFGASHVEVETFGNVYAATAFLHGLAVEEVDRRKLDVNDPCYPVTVAIRAMRAD
jgi:SAM-dependent methyltransferase